MNRKEDKLFNHPWIKEVSEGRIRSLKRELSHTNSRRTRPGEAAEVDAILKTIDYKGFRKGSRQIYMLLPRITELKIGLHRIQKLMKAYNALGFDTEVLGENRANSAGRRVMEKAREHKLFPKDETSYDGSVPIKRISKFMKEMYLVAKSHAGTHTSIRHRITMSAPHRKTRSHRNSS